MNIGFLITARLKSTRLRKKILLDLNGKSVLDRVIERTKSVKNINKVVLCTSVNPQDNQLEEYALKNKIEFFRGSEDDVLDRLLNAAKLYHLDGFASITADNPLFSTEAATMMTEMYKKYGFDFIYNKGLPIGCFSYFLDVQALAIAHEIKQKSDTEIWGPFINRPDFFNVGELWFTGYKSLEEKRLTLDYDEDYKLIKNIYNHFPSDFIPNLADLVSFFKQYPEIERLNKNKTQSSVAPEILNEIEQYFNQMKDTGKNFAEKIGKKLKPDLTVIKEEAVGAKDY